MFGGRCDRSLPAAVLAVPSSLTPLFGWPVSAGAIGDAKGEGAMGPLGVRCPSCGSESVRLTLPESPEVSSYRCNDCDRAWSEDIFRLPSEFHLPPGSRDNDRE